MFFIAFCREGWIVDRHICNKFPLSSHPRNDSLEIMYSGYFCFLFTIFVMFTCKWQSQCWPGKKDHIYCRRAGFRRR